ncbi:MAG: CDP-diacylglycerol--glycerol-3-phosphate 3-phosphatidyltransferase [Pseudomonadota bacterium]
MPKLMYNIPNLLSSYRIAILPVLTLFFYIDGATATWINVVIFFFACVSDGLDGYIARSTGQTSIYGKFLDATADKIMIGGVLMLLVAFDRITGVWIIPALIIFIREILVSGLREFLGLYKISVPISRIGKLKTLAQMFACGFLMAGDYGPALVPHSYAIGLFGLVVATVMTVVSGWDYMKAGIETIRNLDAEASEKAEKKDVLNT